MFGFNLTEETSGMDGFSWPGQQARQNDLMSYPRFVSCSGSMFDQETEKMSSQTIPNSLISLQEVLLSKTVQNSDKAEYYTMAYLDHECNGG